MHEPLFDNSHDIPLAESLSLTKLANHGVITTDMFNPARKLLDY